MVRWPPLELNATIVWAVVGIVLLILEMTTGTFALLFFGLAALAVSLLRKLAGLDQLAVELVLFAVLGLAGLVLFRKKILASLNASKSDLHLDQNAWVILSSDVPARDLAPILYQGVTWTALNTSDQDLKKGSRAFISGTEGVKLLIRPDDPRIPFKENSL